MAATQVRRFATSALRLKFNAPLTNNEMVRTGGIASMFRLPVYKDTKELDACFVGIPMDVGCSNRPGARFGPKAIRQESAMIRGKNNDTKITPFEALQVGDVGDVQVNQYDIKEACQMIKNAYSKHIQNGCVPLTMGGDHTVTYPILQAMKEKYGKVALIHVDAHTGMYGAILNAKIHHRNTLNLAVKEGLIDCDKTIQIGLRGSGYGDDYEAGKKLGFTVVPAKEWRSLITMLEYFRDPLDKTPTYLSFDIDALDPAYAPGTGTPEIAGLTSREALDIIRSCVGFNIVGCEVVEVSPPYDFAGTTSVLAANLLFEMLCLVPGREKE